jgi:hypothetical protein
MTSALDQFEDSLVRASRALQREHTVVDASPGNVRGGGVTTTSAPRAKRTRTLLWRRGRRPAAGALLVGVLAAAGVSVFGPTGNPKEIPQVQCGARGSSAEMTGEPVRDCATLWPSLYHHPAPALVAWVSETGGVVVVTPAGKQPAGSGWRRLPSGWRADSAVLALHTQLEDITTGIQARPCWSPTAASTLVSFILRSDGLASWHVRVKTERANGAHPDCLNVAAVTGAEPRSVLLVERAVQEPAGFSPSSPTFLPSKGDARIALVETQLNASLKAPGHCASVTHAAALWRSRAHLEHVPASSYVLFTQASARYRAQRCARVLVNAPGGGGPADVYAAALP